MKVFFALAFFMLSSSGFAKPAAALNPIEPSTLCDRFIQDKAKSFCQEKAKKLDLDWYAATVCNLIENDDQFMNCWTDVDGKIYSPPDLVDCASEDLQDEDRRACLLKVSRKTPKSSNRVPAAEDKKKPASLPIYQPLKNKN